MNKKTGTLFMLMLALGFIVSCVAGSGSNNSFWGDYAGSGLDLSRFKEKYEEIKSDGSLPKDNWGIYAGSGQSLSRFKEKYEEIKSDGSLLK